MKQQQHPKAEAGLGCMTLAAAWAFSLRQLIKLEQIQSSIKRNLHLEIPLCMSRTNNSKMAESSPQSKGAERGMDALNDPVATFEKMQELLKAKDDTSRFVGLALLKTVLDNGQLINDPQRLRILWDALSPKFLDRLLRAHQNEKVSRTDSKDMVDLAVAVLHTFSILLPEEARREKRLTGRTAPLVKALIQR